MLFVFSSRIFSKSEGWDYSSSNPFEIGTGHKASLPVPFSCPPAILAFFNDSYDVSFVDVQFIHVLRGDREKKTWLAWEHMGTQACIWWGFDPAFLWESVSVILVGNKLKIPDSEGLSNYGAGYFLKILRNFPSVPVVTSWAAWLVHPGRRLEGVNATVLTQPAVTFPQSAGVARLNSLRLNSQGR